MFIITKALTVIIMVTFSFTPAAAAPEPTITLTQLSGGSGGVIPAN